MKEENKQQEPTKQAWNIADVIGWLLFSNACFNFLSSAIYASIDATSDKWFERFLASMICFGFFAIIYRLRK